MSAFKGYQITELKAAALEILQPARSQNTLELSEADVLSLFQTRKSRCRVELPFQVTWTAPHLEEVPLSFKLTGNRGAARDPDFADKINTWIEQHKRHVYERALCWWVVEHLCKVCSNWQQVRYLWPTVLLLCSKREQLKEIADSVRDFKAPRSVPALEPAARNALIEATAILTMNSMVEGEGVWRGEVEIECTKTFQFSAHGLWLTAQ